MAFLTDEQMDRIHRAGLELLETVGVKVDHPAVFRRLCEEGAEGEADGLTVRFPRELVARCLASAPRAARFADRRGGTVEVGADGGTVFWSGNALYLAKGRECVEITTRELAIISRLIDGLDRIHGIVGTSIADYPPAVRDIVGFRVMAENSRKHLRPCIFTGDGPTAILEMAEVLLEGASLRERPIVSFGYSIVSPCHWTRVGLEVYLNTSGYGLPAMVNAEPLGGGTAPVTLAGLLTQANAEALSGIVILQVLEPGRPSIYNLGFAHLLDMRAALATSGNVQDGMLAAAGADLARYHGLPSASWLSSDNPICDAQSTLQRALTGALHATAGVNIIWGMGQLETEKTLSLEQLVIDDEMAAQLLRAQRGIEVTEETIALEVLKEGIRKGDFLSLDHTLDHFREEVLPDHLLGPQRRDQWEAAGSLDLVERAAKRVEEILAAPQEPCVTPEQSERLREIERKWVGRLA